MTSTFSELTRSAALGVVKRPYVNTTAVSNNHFVVHFLYFDTVRTGIPALPIRFMASSLAWFFLPVFAFQSNHFYIEATLFCSDNRAGDFW